METRFDFNLVACIYSIVAAIWKIFWIHNTLEWNLLFWNTNFSRTAMIPLFAFSCCCCCCCFFGYCFDVFVLLCGLVHPSIRLIALHSICQCVEIMIAGPQDTATKNKTEQPNEKYKKINEKNRKPKIVAIQMRVCVYVCV